MLLVLAVKTYVLGGCMTPIAFAVLGTGILFGCYNLAVASLLARNNAKASYALQEFFKRSTITESSTAWYKFLELSLESGSILILVEFLKRSLNQQQVNDTQLILESVVFLLCLNQHHRRLCLIWHQQQCHFL